MEQADSVSSGLKMDRSGSFFYPTVIAPNNNLPGGFYQVSPIPFAYEIHLFIKNFLPRQPARLFATIWMILTIASCATLCTLLNLLFLAVWWLLRPFLSSSSFYYVLEYVPSLFTNRCSQIALTLNCFTNPLFEYRPPAPLPTSSVFHEEVNRWCSLNKSRSGNCSEGLVAHSSTSQLDDYNSFVMGSSSFIGSSVSTCTSLSPYCIDTDKAIFDKADLTQRRQASSFLEKPKNEFGIVRRSKSLSVEEMETISTESSVGSEFDLSPRQLNPSPPTVTNFTPGRTIVMSNHLSTADGGIIAGVSKGWPLKMIYKDSIHKIPFLGPCILSGRHIPVYFNSSKGGWGVEKSAVIDMMTRIAELVNMSIPVMVFPEGERQKFNRMTTFRTGLFRFCVESQVEIYPTVIYGSQYCYPLNNYLADFHEAYIVYGTEAVQPHGHTVESLVDTVRNKMVELLKLCPGYNHEVEKPIETPEEYAKLAQEAKLNSKLEQEAKQKKL